MLSALTIAASLITSSGALASAAPPPAGPWGASGTVTIRGRVSEVLSLRLFSHQTFGRGVTGAPESAPGSAFSYTMDLGDLTQAAQEGAALLGGNVTLILRTNTPYTLSADAKGTGFHAGPGYIQLRDIGFAVPSGAIAASGALASNTNTRLRAAIDNDLFSAPVSGAGEEAFPASLEDLVGGTQLLQGESISNRGTLSSPNNGLLVTTGYAVRPQLFRSQAPFSVTVTYTLATP